MIFYIYLYSCSYSFEFFSLFFKIWMTYSYLDLLYLNYIFIFVTLYLFFFFKFLLFFIILLVFFIILCLNCVQCFVVGFVLRSQILHFTSQTIPKMRYAIWKMNLLKKIKINWALCFMSLVFFLQVSEIVYEEDVLYGWFMI